MIYGLDFDLDVFIYPGMGWFWLVVGIVYLLSAVGMSRVFPRLDIPQAKAWIPIYNVVLLFRAVSIPAVFSLVFVVAALSIMYSWAALINAFDMIQVTISTSLTYTGVLFTEEQAFQATLFTLSTFIAWAIAVVSTIASAILVSATVSRVAKTLNAPNSQRNHSENVLKA